MVRRGALLLVVVLLFGACGGNSTPPTPTESNGGGQASGSATSAATPAPELSWEQIIEALRPSTVMIRADFPATAVSDQSAGSGTGIVYNSDGYIITNAHVVDGAAALTVSAAGSNRERPAQFVGISPCDDLAVIKVDDTQGLQPASFGKSSAQQVGEDVAAIGYPLGSAIGTDISVTRGIISKLDQPLAPYESLIQTDAAINPGNSGGPLVNRQGQVVGINTLAVDRTLATNINFSISIDQAMTVIPDLMKERNRLWLGMNLAPNDYEKYFGTSNGLVVDAVASGGPAASADIQPAYLLTQLAGLDVNSMADVCKILRSHKDGDSLKVQFLNITRTERQLLEGDIIVGQGTGAVPVKVVDSEPLEGTTPTTTTGQVTPTTGSGSGNVATRSWDFSSDTGDWYTGEYDDVSVTISGGSYNFQFKQPNYIRAAAPKSVPAAGDQAVAADVKVGAGEAGVVARWSANSDNQWTYYLCYISQSGEYGCEVSVNDQYTTLIPATQSNAIKAGSYNRIQLMIVGTKGTVTINGTQVGTFDDNKVSSGKPGLYAGGLKDVNGAASFKNVTIQYVQ